MTKSATRKQGVTMRIDADLWQWLEVHAGHGRRTQWFEDRIREARDGASSTQAVRLADELEAIARRLRGISS